MGENTDFACSQCSAVWQKRGETNCWSRNPDAPAARPATCPTEGHRDVIDESFDVYAGDTEDAAMARTAAKVEGMCYQPVPGSDAVNARWTRVEDTIAFAKLMGYGKIGIATCIGLLDESNKLSAILKAQGFSPISVCCKTGSIDKIKLGL